VLSALTITIAATGITAIDTAAIDRRGEKVESFRSKIPNPFGICSKLFRHPHEVLSRVFTHPELSFDPRQEVAVD
jgi:hypothetical protein